MPMYTYKCAACEKQDTDYRTIENRNEPMECECGQKMQRDVFAESPKTHNDYYKTVYSDAMGIHPDQVSEHRKAYPDIPVTNDGRVIVRSHTEHRRIMKKLGFYDKAGYF